MSEIEKNEQFYELMNYVYLKYLNRSDINPILNLALQTEINKKRFKYSYNKLVMLLDKDLYEKNQENVENYIDFCLTKYNEKLDRKYQKKLNKLLKRH